MSAFIVEDRTINIIVNWIDTNEYLKRELKKLNYDTDNPDYKEMLANDMFYLNVEAVEQRYGDGEAEKFRDLNFKYVPYYSAPMIQVYKALNCYLYQCYEGNVPEAPLIKFLDEEVRLTLADEIISKLPEYKHASWG